MKARPLQVIRQHRMLHVWPVATHTLHGLAYFNAVQIQVEFYLSNTRVVVPRTIAGTSSRSPHHSARKRCHIIYRLGIRRPRGLTMHSSAPLIRSSFPIRPQPFKRRRALPQHSPKRLREVPISYSFLCVLWHFGTTRTLARSDLVLRNNGSYLRFQRYTLLHTRI